MDLGISGVPGQGFQPGGKINMIFRSLREVHIRTDLPGRVVFACMLVLVLVLVRVCMRANMEVQCGMHGGDHIAGIHFNKL